MVAVEVAGRFADLSSCCDCCLVGDESTCIDGSGIALLLFRFRTGGVGGADEDEDELDDAVDNTVDETEDDVFEDEWDVNEAMPSSSTAASSPDTGDCPLDVNEVAR